MKTISRFFLALTGLIFAATFALATSKCVSPDNPTLLFAFLFIPSALVTLVSAFGSSITALGLFTLINVSGITFNGKEAMNLGEAVLEDAFTNPAITDFHTIHENIVAKEQIPFLSTLKKITKKDPGCGSGVTSKTIATSEKFWNPEKIKIWLVQCADDLEASFFVWGENNGIDRKDLTRSDFIKFVLQRMEEATLEDALRICWFGDTAVAHTTDSPAGVLAPASDLTDFNHIDGFWKQLYAIAVATPARRYTITENALGTHTLQDGLAADRALKVFENLKYKADYRLRGKKDLIILATQSLLDNYAAYLRNVSAVDAAYLRIEGGYDALKFEGILIIAVPQWDRVIREDYDNGTTYYLPHRALLTTKENLAIGIDALAELGKFKVFYDDYTELNNMKGGYKLDAKVLQDYMVQVAY